MKAHGTQRYIENNKVMKSTLYFKASFNNYALRYTLTAFQQLVQCAINDEIIFSVAYH